MEKEELGNLNDRLAAYIDKVRQLEAEKKRLTQLVESKEGTSSCDGGGSSRSPFGPVTPGGSGSGRT